MNRTKIEWAQNPDGTPGYTWNPITGCLNNCSYCYARTLANSRVKSRYLANEHLAGGYPLARGVLKEGAIPPSQDPFYPRFWSDKLTADKNNPLSRKKPIGVFVCDMGDLFGIGVSGNWTQRVLNYIAQCRQHRFYLLTKQPQNLIKFSPFPGNCWVGVSATGNKAYHKAIDVLSEIDAKVKYLSIEPLLERIEVDDYLINAADWVIIGAQTKPTVMPKIEWVREIVEAADGYGIPVLLKDNLRDLLVSDALMDDIFWASDKAELRQELPDATR